MRIAHWGRVRIVSLGRAEQIGRVEADLDWADVEGHGGAGSVSLLLDEVPSTRSLGFEVQGLN
jgi:hypothetical protein